MGAAVFSPPAVGSVPANASWAQVPWFFDPQNLSTTASNNNDGKTAVTPLLNWSAMIARYGTYSPILSVAPTWTFISSHTDYSDPVILTPYVRGVSPLLTATNPAVVIAGVLGVVTPNPRDATAAGLRVATLPAGATVGMIIVNATRGDSRARVQRALGAGAFQLSQPFAPAVIGLLPSAQNNAWATGDAVTIYTPRAIALGRFEPTLLQGGALNDQLLAMSNVQVLNTGVGSPKIDIGPNLQTWDVDYQAFVSLSPRVVSGSYNTHENCSFSGQLMGGQAMTYDEGVSGAQTLINGGYSGPGSVIFLMGCQLDGGHIVGEGDATLLNCSYGEVAIDAASGLQVTGIGAAAGGPAWYSGSKFWGPGTLRVDGPAVLTYAGTAVATFKLGSIVVGGLTTAAPGLGGTAIAITAANIDLAATAGGFNGVVGNGNGATITNGSALSWIGKIQLLGSNSDFVACGATPATVGAFRQPNNQPGLNSRNAANTANLNCAGYDASDNLILGTFSGAGLAIGAATFVCGGTGGIVLQSNSSLIVTALRATNTVTYKAPAAVTSILFGYVATTTANGGSSTWAGQDSTLAGGNGGAAVIQGGAKNGTGLRGPVQIQLNGTTEIMVEATEVVSGNRVVAIARTAAMTATQMPANTGDGVVYLANATTNPTANPVAGIIHYGNAGSATTRGTGGTTTAYGPA